MGISVLGPVAIEGERGFLGPRDRVVLAALAVRPGDVVQTEELADALWGGRPPATSSKVIQGCIVRLRKRLGAGAIETAPGGYRLSVEPDAVDASRFEHLVQRGRRLMADRSPERAAEVLAEGLALWRGRPLVELEAWPPGSIEAVRLAELRLDAEDDYLQAALSAGRHQEVLADARARVAECPLRERRWVLLADAQRRSGRQGDALRTIHEARGVAAERGLDPGSEILSLEQAILRGDQPAAPREPAAPALATVPGVPIDAPPGRRSSDRRTGTRRAAALPTGGVPSVLRAATSSVPFCGRGAEDAAMQRAWEGARDGGFEVVLVGGEPGIGKTRLVARVALRAQAQGATVLAGRCDKDVRVPFGPFAGALRWMVQHTEPGVLARHLGEHPAELVALAPEIARSVDGLVPRPSTDAETERTRLFDAVCAWLRPEGSSTSGTVIVLDDLQWADTGTVLLLRHLVRAAPEGLLVLGTYRDTEVPASHPLTSALADLRPLPAVTRVRLRGLDPAAVRDIVQGSARRTLDAEGVAFADLVWTETAGNPLFVGQLLHHLAEIGALVHRDGHWTGDLDLAAIGIPDSVREVIGRRLATLPAATAALLRAAAVTGLEFDVGLLAEVVDRADDEVLDGLEQALGAALVTEVGVDRFRFAHALVRDTLHADLSASRRAREHRRVAAAIERRHVEDLDAVAAELARHWREACAGGDPSPAVAWASRAGEHDLTRRAPHQAASWFAEALALSGEAASGPGHRHLLSRLAHAQARAGDPAAEATARLSARLALDAGDVGAAAAVLCLSARRSYDREQQPDHDKIALLERTLALVDDDAVLLRGRLLAQLAGELVFVGSFERRDAILDELSVLVDSVQDPVERWGLMGKGTLGPGRRWTDPAVIRRVCRSCHEAAATLADPFEREKAQIVLWPLAASVGDRDRCDQAVDALSREETPTAEVSHHFFALASAYLDGRFDDFEAHATAITEHFRVLHHPEARTFEVGSALLLCRERDRMLDMVPYVERWAGSPAREGRSARWWSARDAMAAYTRLLTGRRDLVALDRFDPARVPDGTGWPATVAMTGEVVAVLGDDRLVRQMLAVVTPRRGLHLVSGAFYNGSHDRLAALLHDRLGQHDEADEAFAAAVRGHHRLRTPVWVARSELDWAASLVRRDRHDAARVRVREARAAIGDLPLAESRRRADELDWLLR